MTGDQVRVGDIVMFLGTPHLIDAIEDALHPTLGSHRLAKTADGWTIGLWPEVTYEVRRAV